MAKKSAGRLAGLAALGAAAYMMNEKFGKGKDAKGPSATAAEKDASDARTKAQREAVSGNKTVEKSSSAYNPVTSSDTPGQVARNRGVGDAENDPLPETPKLKAKVDADANANAPAEVKHGDPSQSKGVLRSDRDMTQAEAKKILNQTPADKAKQAAKDKKAIASNKADSRAFQRNTDAAKVANLKSNAEFNRKQQAKKASVVNQIPGQNRSGPTGGERVSGTELSRNLSNTAVALSPLTGGTSKVAAEFAMGRNAAKALQGEGKLSAAGQRLKNMEEVRNVAMPGRNATVTNPNAWAAGPKGMDKIAQAEARAAAAEARAAAAEAKRNAKDPFMSFKPGSDFKRGGMTKMASGGMTASRRGDGIASRGKTKCKMY